jgi:putative transposase
MFTITFYHIIWTTQNRQPLITRANEGAIIDAIDELNEQMGGKLYAVGVLADHVHVAVSIPPRVAVLDWVREAKVKTAAAAQMVKDDAPPLFWSQECGIVTFGSQNRERMVRYVKRQKAIHAEGEGIDILERAE